MGMCVHVHSIHVIVCTLVVGVILVLVHMCVCVCVCVCTLSMRLWTPCLPVKMIEEVEERFSEDEIQELLELVTMVLPDSSGQEAMETESLRTTNKEDGIGT